MQTIQEHLAKLRGFNFQDELQVIIEDNKERVADLQADQLSQGLRNDGRQINPQYTKYTVAAKQQFGVGLGAVTDRVTFYDTGELYKSLRVKVTPTTFTIQSDNFKFDKMIKRSGKETVGLSKDYCDMFVQSYTKPIIARRMREVLGVG